MESNKDIEITALPINSYGKADYQINVLPYTSLNMKKLMIIPLIFLNVAMMKAQDTIHYKPIGIFHTGYNVSTGAPRQGILKPEGKGKIELLPEYHSALLSLDRNEYIIVLYHLHGIESWKPYVHPPGSDPNDKFGLFATRTPRRPNPIGFSVIKLEKIENGMLYVSGVDAFDGTPVLDIKPFVPSIDCVESEQNESNEIKMGLKKN